MIQVLVDNLISIAIKLCGEWRQFQIVVLKRLDVIGVLYVNLKLVLICFVSVVSNLKSISWILRRFFHLKLEEEDSHHFPKFRILEKAKHRKTSSKNRFLLMMNVFWVKRSVYEVIKNRVHHRKETEKPSKILVFARKKHGKSDDAYRWRWWSWFTLLIAYDWSLLLCIGYLHSKIAS